MNYLAHLFLAQPTPDSYLGNLLGDFRRGVAVAHYSRPVLNGLQNHYRVDKFTDHHPLVKEAKRRFSPARRRFAGIALDVVFDHFLIKHWHHYSDEHFSKFCDRAYQLLSARVAIMPPRMQDVVEGMLAHRWLQQYETIAGVGYALDRTAARIRFTNQFAGVEEELRQHYDELDTCFREFFPQLISHVEQQSAEDNPPAAIKPHTLRP